MKLFLCSHFSSVGSLIKEEIENKKVSKKVQDKVKSSIENMTGLEVADVNIRIAGVDMENDK